MDDVAFSDLAWHFRLSGPQILRTRCCVSRPDARNCRCNSIFTVAALPRFLQLRSCRSSIPVYYPFTPLPHQRLHLACLFVFSIDLLPNASLRDQILAPSIVTPPYRQNTFTVQRPLGHIHRAFVFGVEDLHSDVAVLATSTRSRSSRNMSLQP